MSAQQQRLLDRRRAIWGVLAGAAAMAGCAAPAATRVSAPEASGRTEAAGVRAQAADPSQTDSFDERAAMAGIQDVLDRQSAARAAGDKAAFLKTIDPDNLTWRRIQSETFDASNGLPRGRKYVVTRVMPKHTPYVKAWIDVLPQGGGEPTQQGVWVFRPAENDGGWLHTEILNEEIGSRQALDTEHFRLVHFEWDADVITRMGDVAEQAYATVTQRLGTAPPFRVVLSINPTYGSHSGLRGLGTWAAYSPSAKDTLLIRSMESYGAGLTAVGETQEERLLVAVTHELTHLVNDQIVPIVKVPHWASEGLADYVASNLRRTQVAEAVRSQKALTLDKASDIIEYAYDASRAYTAADVSLAYGFSSYGVMFFIERFGLDKLFEVERHFADSRRWEASFRSVLGEDWGQFQAAFQDWLRRKLGL
jgi:hypothetical protein